MSVAPIARLTMSSFLLAVSGLSAGAVMGAAGPFIANCCATEFQITSTKFGGVASIWEMSVDILPLELVEE